MCNINPKGGMFVHVYLFFQLQMRSRRLHTYVNACACHSYHPLYKDHQFYEQLAAPVNEHTSQAPLCVCLHFYRTDTTGADGAGVGGVEGCTHTVAGAAENTEATATTFCHQRASVATVTANGIPARTNNAYY